MMPARARLRERASQRRRFGWRLYCEERQQVRRRSGRKQGALGRWWADDGSQRTEQALELNVVSDAFPARRFRILAAIGEYSRECVRLIAETSIFGARVRRELDAAEFEKMARPRTKIGDNETEMTSIGIPRRSKERKVSGTISHRMSPITTGSSRVSMRI